MKTRVVRGTACVSAGVRLSGTEQKEEGAQISLTPPSSEA